MLEENEAIPEKFEELSSQTGVMSRSNVLNIDDHDWSPSGQVMIIDS